MTFTVSGDNLTNMEKNEKEGYKMILIHHHQTTAHKLITVTSPLKHIKL
ncbi:hypothetical protein KIS4809_3139 [Bacillus sp. ZZV12-4809]|nr:hypothetical protein KIS4809_3139 [Bacillus sp. ZZV12-4809]